MDLLILSLASLTLLVLQTILTIMTTTEMMISSMRSMRIIFLSNCSDTCEATPRVELMNAMVTIVITIMMTGPSKNERREEVWSETDHAELE